MSRDGGDLDEYLSLGATPELESRWRKDMVNEYVRKAQAADEHALTNLVVLEAVEALPALAELVWKGDGFYRVRCAETIDQLVGFPRDATSEAGAALQRARQSCREIAAGRFTAPGAVPRSVLELEGEEDPRSYVIERARRFLPERLPPRSLLGRMWSALFSRAL